jgi:HEAT repeat protein
MKITSRLSALLPSLLLALATTAAVAQEAPLIALIKSDAPLKEKADACRELARVGGADAVPALAGLLDDAQLAHMARYALEPMVDPAAGIALREALGRLKGGHLAGVIASVGVRRDGQAVEVIAACLKDPEVEVARAAALALGRIGNEAAGLSLQKALAGAPPAVLPDLAEGCLRCADALASGAGARLAADLYAAVEASPAPDSARLAAARGAILARGEKGLPLLQEQLRSEDGRRFALALGLAKDLPGPALAKLLAEAVSGLPPARQIPVLGLLGDRGGAESMPVILGLARSATNEVREAAVRALGQLGDLTALSPLIELVADSDPMVAAAAKAAVSGFPEGLADAAIVELLGSAKPELRQIAIGLVGQRRITNAVPALLKIAGDADAALGTASLKVLSDLGGQGDVPALIEVLLKSSSPQAAESTLVAVCTRLSGKTDCRILVNKAVFGDLPAGASADVTKAVVRLVRGGASAVDATVANFGDPADGIVKKLRVEYTADGRPMQQTVREGETLTFTASAMDPACVEALHGALARAPAAPRLALLRILRSSGDPRGIAAVRSAAADGDATIREGAQRILCDWPTSEAMPDLRQLAGAVAEAKLKILALRGFIRLAAQSGLPAQQQLDGLRDALNMAERNEERLLVISALGAVPRAEALAILTPCLGDPELKEAASLAAVDIAEKIPAPRPVAVAAAMEAVAKATANPTLAQRAAALRPAPTP